MLLKLRLPQRSNHPQTESEPHSLPIYACRLASLAGAEVFDTSIPDEAVSRSGAGDLKTFTPLQMIGSLESFSGAFLYTHSDTVSLMQGIPTDAVRSLRASTRKPLIVAGGIATSEQLDQLDAMKIDVVVGMAISTGRAELTPPASGTRPHPNIK